MTVSNLRSSAAGLISLLAFSVSLVHGQAAQPSGNAPENQATSVLQPKTMAGSTGNSLNVICKGDQLTISANNSTLASILAEVQKCIGTPITIPVGAGNNRFFDTIGPGPIRTVLASLLNGTGFNFVIKSSDSDPQNVQTVVLMARVDDVTLDAAADRALTPARRAYLQMLQNSRVEAQSHNESQNESSTGASDSENTPSDQSAAQQQAPSTAPNVSQEETADQSVATGTTETPPSSKASDASATATAPDSAPKAVDDQITNMEQMFEQRRQMMRTSNPAPQ